jgi:hypothetical protein
MRPVCTQMQENGGAASAVGIGIGIGFAIAIAVDAGSQGNGRALSCCYLSVGDDSDSRPGLAHPRFVGLLNATLFTTDYA